MSFSPRRFAGATTATAVIAFLLIVPTVLHFAVPAFGQGTGSGNGYAVTLDIGAGQQVNASTPVGSVSVGQNVTVRFNVPAPVELLEPASLLDTTGAVRESALVSIIEQPKILGVTITSGTDSAAVTVNVREFLPTDPALNAVVSAAPGTSVANVILKVSSPKIEGATAPAGTTVEYRALKVMEIHADGIEKGGVESATVDFRVTAAEMDALGLTPADIALLHLVDGDWVELPTTFLGTENGAFLFSAVTPSFSYFAVAAKQVAQESVIEEAGASLGMVAFVLAAIVVVAVGVVVVLKRQGKL